MKKQESSVVPPVNLKEQNASHTFKVKIRDRDHFYKIVNWLNTNVGKGMEYWSMEGRPLRAIKQGKNPDTKIYIFSKDFAEENALYLSLL